MWKRYKESLLKGTITKITNQEEGFLNFIRSLTTAGFPLIKSKPTQFGNNVLFQLGLSEGMSVADVTFQKKIYGSGRPSDLA